MPFIVTAPPKYHAAFNPIEFKVSSTIPASFSLDVVITKPLVSPVDVRTITLNRITKDIGGQSVNLYLSRFDITSIARALFDNPSPTMINNIEVDHRLFAKYQAGIQGDTMSTYVALNSALPIGEFVNFTSLAPNPLTTLPVITEYAGYPIDVSIFAYTSANGLTADAVNRVKLSAIPNELLLANSQGAYIVNSAGKFIIIRTGNTMPIGSACAPDNPFYVRWINRLGGIDYFMFDVSQKREMVTKDFTRTKTYYENSVQARGTEKTIGVNVSSLITVKAEMLKTDMYNALALIPLSPLIEWYNETLGVWQVINIEKADNERYTHSNSHTIEFVFELPTPIIQF